MLHFVAPEFIIGFRFQNLGEITLNNIAILVISCDKYSDLWPIFFGSLFKYWPNCSLKIYLGSNYKKFHHNNVTMINIGDDSDYSSNLLAMVKEIEEDYVITTVEDVFFSAPVDEEHLFLHFQEFFDNNATYLKLLPSYPCGYDRDVSKRIASVASGVRYRLGVGASLWNKRILTSNLVPGMSAWQMEREGVFGKDIPATDVYAVNYHFSGKIPFQYVHGVMKGAWIRKAIPWLKKEGYQECLINREVMTLTGSLYTWLFAILMAIFKKIDFRWRP